MQAIQSVSYTTKIHITLHTKSIAKTKGPNKMGFPSNNCFIFVLLTWLYRWVGKIQLTPRLDRKVESWNWRSKIEQSIRLMGLMHQIILTFYYEIYNHTTKTLNNERKVKWKIVPANNIITLVNDLNSKPKKWELIT